MVKIPNNQKSGEDINDLKQSYIYFLRKKSLHLSAGF
jgi:hypothetical protein